MELMDRITTCANTGMIQGTGTLLLTTEL